MKISKLCADIFFKSQTFIKVLLYFYKKHDNFEKCTVNFSKFGNFYECCDKFFK